VVLRRTLAVALVAFGGLLLAGAGLVGIAAGAYSAYTGLKWAFIDGEIAGVFLIMLVPVAVLFAGGILAIPASALLASGSSLWTESRRAVSASSGETAVPHAASRYGERNAPTGNDRRPDSQHVVV